MEKNSHGGRGGMNQQERCLWLIQALLKDMPQYGDTPIPASPDDRWRLLRSLMNVRPPMPVSEAFLQIQDAFLRQMTAEKGVLDAAALAPSAKDSRLVIWQGDITTLKSDAIVNAANSQMLGCFSPCHSCIDNIVHTKTVRQNMLKHDPASPMLIGYLMQGHVAHEAKQESWIDGQIRLI